MGFRVYRKGNFSGKITPPPRTSGSRFVLGNLAQSAIAYCMAKTNFRPMRAGGPYPPQPTGTTPTIRVVLRSHVLIAALGLFLTTALCGQITWTGGSGSGAWGTAGNWDTGVPTSTDDTVFDAAAANSQYSITLGANRSILGLTFASTGSNAFTFNSGNFLTIGVNGITNNHSLAQIFDAEVRTSGNQTWNAGSGGFTFEDLRLGSILTLEGSGTVAINGTLTNAGSRTLTNNLSSTLTLHDIALTTNATNRTLSLRGTGTTVIDGIVADGSTGAGTLRLRDTGTYTLNGANTHTGGTWLNGATLIMGDANALGTGTLTLQSGTFDGGSTNRTISNAVTLSGSTTLAGSADLNFTSTLTLTANRTLTLSATGANTLSNVELSSDATARRLTIAGNEDLTIAGVISDGVAGAGGRLLKNDTGTLTLTGTNTYSGDTTLNAGTVIVGSNAAFGNGAGSVALGAITLQGDGSARSIANDGTLTGNLTVGGSSDLNLAGTFTLTGNRTLTLDNTGTTTIGGLNLSSNANNRTFTLAGAGDLNVTGAIGNGTGGALATKLTLNGTGTVTLDGDNNYGGITTMNSGTLVLNGNNATTGNFDLNGGTVTIGHDNAFGSSLLDLSGATLQSDGSPRTVANAISLTGSSATLGGASDLTLTGTTTLTGNRTLTVTNTGTTRLGNIDLSNSATNRTLTVDAATTASIEGVIANGSTSTAGSLTKTGAGTLTLAGANTYDGTTTVSTGTLVATHANALGSTTGSTAVSSGASLELQNNITIASEALAVTGTGRLHNATDSNTFAGVISGTGEVVVDGGSLTLSAANTYLGATTINSGGTLVATHAGALGGSGTGTTVASGGTLEISGGITIASEDLSVTGTGRLLNASGTNTYGGVISGTGGVTVSGGELTLSGTNTYTGTTAITAGILTLGADSLLSTGTTVAIGSSGTFHLAGYNQRVGDLSADGGATLDFGSTAGANSFLFDTFAAPSSGVLVINNWEDGIDQLATTIGSQDVSTIYLAGFGVAQLDTGTTTVLGTSAYLITAATLGFKEWDGGGSGSNWGTNSNWGPSAGEPGTTEYALFDDEDNGKSTISLDQNDTIAGIEFGENATVGYTLNSAAAEVLTLDGAVPFIQQKNAFNQTIALAGLELGNNTVADITGSGDLIISADISESSGGTSLVRDGGGSGTLVLSGDNTFSGGLYLNNGIVEAQSSGALGTGTAVIASGATLELNGVGTIDENITFGGTGVSNAGALHNTAGTNTLSGILTATSAGRITTDTGTTLNLTGNLTGTDTDLTFAAAGTGAINVSRITTGAGTVTIESGAITFNGANANTFTGLTTVSGGTLTLDKTAGADAIGSGGLTLADGTSVTSLASHQINDDAGISLLGTSIFDLNGNTETIARLDSVSTTATVALGSTGNLTIGAPGVLDSAFGGQLTGGSGSSLTFDGGGTLSLSAGNTAFSGAVNVVSGNVHASGSNDALGSGAVTVSSGGSLQLEGGINLDNTLQLAGTGSAANGAVENVGGSNTLSGTISLAAGSTFNTTAGTLSVSGVVSGSNALTKEGAGTLVLSGTNTYSGATIVNGGILAITSESNLGATPGSPTAGQLSLDGGTLHTTASLSLDANRGITIGSSGGDFNVDTGTTTTLNGVIDGTGILTKAGDGTLVVNGTNTHTGSLTMDAGTLALNAAQSFTGNIQLNDGTVIIGDDAAFGTGVLRLKGSTLQGDGSARTLDNTVRVQTSTSTLAGSDDLTFTGKLINHNADNTLNVTNTGLTTFTDVDLSNNSTNRTFTLNTSGDVLIGGVVADGSTSTSNFITSGSGTVTLAGANTFSGDLTIGPGTTLVATADDALGSGGGSVTVQDGGTLELQNNLYSDTEDMIYLAGSGVSGDGALLNTSGTNTLISDITLTAATTIGSTGGTLRIGDPANPAWPVQGTVAMGAHDLTFHTDGGDIFLRETLTGTGDVYKTGSGTLTVKNGFNDGSSADFFIQDGTLILDTFNNENLGILGDITVGDGTGAAGSALLQQGELDSLSGLSNNLISDSSNIIINADGYWDLQGYKELVNDVTLNGGTIEAKNSSGSGDRLDIIGVLTASNATTSTIDGRLGMNNDTAKSIVVDASSTLDINAVLSNGGFVKTGDGTLILSAFNSFTGDAQVSGGILQVDNDDGLGGLAGDTIVDAGAQLQLAQVAIGAEQLYLAGSGIASDGALHALTGTTNSWDGNVSLTDHAEIETATGATLTINGGITGSGKTLTVDSLGDTTFTGNNTFNTLNKTGAGTLTVSGVNTYATTNVTTGTFALGASNILTDTMDLNLGAAGTFQVGTFTEVIDDLNGSGTLTIASGGDLTIDQIGDTGAFTGILDVDGILTLNGGTIGAADGTGSTGTIELTAGNTLNIAGDFTFGGTLELADNTTLNLLGAGTTFAVETLHVTGDSVIDFAGVDIATLNIGTLEIDIGGTILATSWASFYDLWTATNFDGAILDERNSTTAQITFNGFSADQTIWLTYDYGPNEITVPEPSTYGAVLMGAALAGYLWRRTRRAGLQPARDRLSNK